MPYIYKKSAKVNNCCKGFTLMELLVVIAVIAMLMAILFPALRKARQLSRCVVCQSNLRQLAAAWHMYLDNNDEKFYQGINANLRYGGWRGIEGMDADPEDPYWPPGRPLNPCLNLPTDIESEDGAEAFLCPADRGGLYNSALLREKVYRAVGTSYQTNIYLIGQDSCSEKTPLLKEISARLPNMTLQRANKPSFLLLIGDYGWVNQWSLWPQDALQKALAEWHGRENWHNLAFLDGHVRFLKIQKGYYVTDEYSMLPFADLYGLARQVQGPPG
jgi:prepilin-type N-terminal cleavage/methylation domain-containing protein/prepilin-type processing-associated H-X9-DG protein